MYRVSTRNAANSNPTNPPAAYSKMSPSISRVEYPELRLDLQFSRMSPTSYRLATITCTGRR